MDLLFAYQVFTLWGWLAVGLALPPQALNIAYVILSRCTRAGLENGLRHADQ